MYEDFYPHFKKQHEPYKGVLTGNISKNDLKRMQRDDPQGLTSPTDWPYNVGPSGKVTERSYNEWLEKCVNPTTNEYYLALDGDRRPIKNTQPKYRIHTIVRLRTAEDRQYGKDSEEVLLSKGRVVGHDEFGNEWSKPIVYPEMWLRSHFKFENKPDGVGSVKRQCMGPSGVENVYELKFTKENAKSLFDKRLTDKIGFVIKDEITDSIYEVRADVNIQKTFERFCKPFEFLLASEYLTPQEKSDLRARGIVEGNYPSIAPAQEMTSVPASPPPKGAYT